MSNGKNERGMGGARSAARGVAAALLCVALAFGSGCASEAASASDQVTDVAESTADTTEVEQGTDGVLSFVLEPDADVPNLRFQVLVDGKTSEGEAVHEYYSAEVGTKYALEYGAGMYALSVVVGTLTHGDVVYKAADASVAFDAQADESVELRVSKDEEATGALAAEKAAAEAAQKEAEEKAAAEKAAAEKAAAEAAAQKEAEEKAAAEKAAAEAAQKEAEEKAAAEAAERQQSESVSAEAQERTVYITKTGTKYHNGNCRHLKKSKIAVSLSDAVSRGYEPCKTCGG